MNLLLGVLAGIIFLTFSPYFYKIMLWKPDEFEEELLKSLASWMVSKGSKSRPQLWTLYFLSIILEATYFILVFTIIKHPVLIVISCFFAGVEFVHLSIVARSLYRFFAGKVILREIFNWRVERISALLFFTHSFLVIVCLFFY